MNLARPESAYQADPYEGGEEEIRRRSVRLVTVRKPQTCVSPTRDVHKITAGTRARLEKAIVSGSWASFYVCLECMDRWLDRLDERLGP